MLHRSAFLASLVTSMAAAHAEPAVHAAPGWISERSADGVVFARQIVPSAAPKLLPANELAKTRTIYLNRNGTTLAPGTNDSQSETSTVVARVSQIAGWDASAADWAETMSCMKDIWSRFDVTITDVDPGATPHVEAVFARSPTELDLPSNIGGISPFTNDCSVIEGSIVFAFTDNLGKKPRTVCEVMSQEIAHSYGLDHELAAEDPMTYLPYSGDREFQDVDASCGEATARPCGVAGSSCRATQNSYQLLRARLGAAGSDNQPPSVAITSPSESEATAGFEITAVATDNIAITSVAFYLDGTLIGTASEPPYQVMTDPGLGQGLHFITVEATDFGGNGTAQQAGVTVIAGADQGLACSAGGPPPLALLGVVLIALLRRRRRAGR